MSKKISQVLKDLNEGDISKPIINSGSATILKVKKKENQIIENLNIENLRKNLINRKRNELYNLYSQSLLSKLKNSTLIEQPNG